mmetsp:Transcript_1193/g.7805  ORF Transcript_1193/g.7805 Transcript_1193/m.7805 type:complete len:287 (-) Transcript_1193:11-871(-)
MGAANSMATYLTDSLDSKRLTLASNISAPSTASGSGSNLEASPESPMRKLSRLAGRLLDGLLGCLAQSAHVLPPSSRFVGVPASSVSLLNSSSSQSSQSSGMDSPSSRGVLRRMAPTLTPARVLLPHQCMAFFRVSRPPGADTSFFPSTIVAFPNSATRMFFHVRCPFPDKHHASMFFFFFFPPHTPLVCVHATDTNTPIRLAGHPPARRGSLVLLLLLWCGMDRTAVSIVLSYLCGSHLISTCTAFDPFVRGWKTCDARVGVVRRRTGGGRACGCACASERKDRP